MGMGAVGPIPYRAIRYYCRGWPLDEQEFFFRVIRALDNQYLGGVAATNQTFNKQMFKDALGDTR